MKSIKLEVLINLVNTSREILSHISSITKKVMVFWILYLAEYKVLVYQRDWITHPVLNR